MKTIPKISTSLLILIAALAMSACGGGGGGDSPAPIKDATDTGGGNGNGNGASTIQKLTGVNGLKIDYQGVYSAPGSTWQGSIVGPVKYTSITTVNAFTLTDSAVPGHFDTFVLKSLSGESLFIEKGGSRVGGATYSRFGWLFGEDPNANNASTTWRTPFAFASSTPASPTDATYAGTNQALLYVQSDQTSAIEGNFFELRCDSSATYTASSKSLQLSLSNCKTTDDKATAFGVAGYVTLAAGNNASTLGIGSQGITNAGLSSESVDSGNFLLAGPNGEELVGAATIKGTFTTYATSDIKPAKLLVVFGGKKLNTN